MSSHPDTLSSGTVWYAQEGPEQDVVLATRIRLVRNLANFVFQAGGAVRPVFEAAQIGEQVIIYKIAQIVPREGFVYV